MSFAVSHLSEAVRIKWGGLFQQDQMLAVFIKTDIVLAMTGGVERAFDPDEMTPRQVRHDVGGSHASLQNIR